MALARRYPNEEAAREWFEAIYWPEGRFCPQCRGTDTYACPQQTMPYRCRTCRKRFSVRTGTVLQASRLPLLQWTYAIYLEMTALKGVSSMKLHRDLGITQKSAWFMLQRIREAFAPLAAAAFEGPVEANETYGWGQGGQQARAQEAESGTRNGW